MTAFRSKWDDWKISDTPRCRTDRTDKSPSVSFVSAALGHIQREKCDIATKSQICGQCAMVVRSDQEYLNVIADGFPGVIHIDCYDAWYDAHLRGRYSD